MTWKDISYLLGSPLSRKVLKTLEKDTLAPVQMAEKAKLDKGNVSKKLSELTKRGLVECMNPDSRKWRFYKITDKGRKTLKEVERVKP